MNYEVESKLVFDMDKTKLKLNIGFIIFLSFILSDKLIKWRKGVQIQERLLWANINWIEEGNLLSPFLSLNFKIEKDGKCQFRL